MGLEDVKQCIAPFPAEERAAALFLVSRLSSEMLQGPASVERLGELSRALEVVHQGFDGLVPIYLMDSGSNRLAFFVDKFPRP
jgi:hypothetical protein